MSSTSTIIRTRDGLRLSGTLVTPERDADRSVVLVHGGGVTQDEAGFFTRLAAGLADAGVASLRFDLRGHGVSEGRQEDLTLSAILNDVHDVLSHVGTRSVSLLGASFSGGICGYYAARGAIELDHLVLFNPLLNYKKRFIDDKPYWHDDSIDDEAAAELATEGFIPHSPTFKLGRPLLNEIRWIQPHTVLGEITTPTMIVHGTKDTFIPIDSSRAAAAQLGGEHELVEIDGAQHGFAVHDDPTYANPQSQEWQAHVIRTVADWLRR
ncbi:alpha/beta fold hydrolase [Kutzneria sp. NPDC051319]|uniref:alpha/beta hydrolase n=1 Tax=Kutzneria sp. NPDC051319 TaxID=3155047 RepID=UPI0034488330